MKQERQPYIKPTRYKHDSGFRVFEVRYTLEMTNDYKVAKKEVLGKCSDHIYQDYLMVIPGEGKPFCINMDLTVDGYIGFFGHGKALEWNTQYATSSMGLREVDELPLNTGESDREA